MDGTPLVIILAWTGSTTVRTWRACGPEPHFNRFTLSPGAFPHEGNARDGLWSRLFQRFQEFQLGLWEKRGTRRGGQLDSFICDGTRAISHPISRSFSARAGP